MMTSIKTKISDYLWIKSVKKYKSRMGFLKAPAYYKYLKRCQKQYLKSKENNPRLPDIVLSAVNDFKLKGVGSFITNESNTLANAIYRNLIVKEVNKNIWSNKDCGRYIAGDIYQDFPEIELLFKNVLQPYLEAIYGAHFQIYYGLIYKSLRKNSSPLGSEIWHSDGGPGTCINLMISLSELSLNNGAMEVLPWPNTVEIFENEREYMRNVFVDNPDNKNDRKDFDRTLRKNYFESQIVEKHADAVVQPVGESGTVISMMNNTIHKGGYPNDGESRYVCIFHIYPYIKQTPYDFYRKQGVAKKGPYPGSNE